MGASLLKVQTPSSVVINYYRRLRIHCKNIKFASQIRGNSVETSDLFKSLISRRTKLLVSVFCIFSPKGLFAGGRTLTPSATLNGHFQGSPVIYSANRPPAGAVASFCEAPQTFIIKRIMKIPREASLVESWKLTILNCFHESRVACKVINLKEQRGTKTIYRLERSLRGNFPHPPPPPSVLHFDFFC